MSKKTRHNTRRKNAKYQGFKSFSCCYCGIVLPIDKLTLEHIIPRAYFKNISDSDFDDNIDLACSECNKKSAKRTTTILNCYKLKLYEEPIIEIKGIYNYYE